MRQSYKLSHFQVSRASKSSKGTSYKDMGGVRYTLLIIGGNIYCMYVLYYKDFCFSKTLHNTHELSGKDVVRV